MKSKLLALLGAGLLGGPIAADAGLVTYDFTVRGTSGPMAGLISSGHVTIDDAPIISDEWFYGSPLDFSFSWNGFSFDESDVSIAISVPFAFGYTISSPFSVLIGSNCSTFGSIVNCSLTGANVGDFGLWFGPFYSFGYRYGNDTDGEGTTTYELRTSVPESGTFALLGLGLAGLGFSRRRKAA